MDGGRASGVLAYDRERGRFHVFTAKAVILATGGVGRAYKITSNSWEGTGDGHALAYRAGAELIDMEFIQFHPTGMVWPPSVQGHSRHRRRARRRRRAEEQRRPPLHVRRHPGQLQAADRVRCRRGLALHAGRQERAASARAADARSRRALHQSARSRPGAARRTAACFSTSRGSRRSCRTPRSTSSASSRACITSSRSSPTSTSRTTPMEVGPTTHYIMGGVRVDADTQMSTIPGLFAAGECAAGINGANRLGGNSLSDLIVFGKRAGEYAARVRAQERAPSRSTTARSSARSRSRWRRSSAARAARIPTRCRRICRTRCRSWSASCAPRARCRKRSTRARRRSSERAARVGVDGPSRIQRRLAHRARPAQPARLCPRPSRSRRSSARKAAAATSAKTIPDKVAGVRHGQHHGQAARRRIRSRVPIPEMPPELKQLSRSRSNSGRSTGT